MSSQASAGSMNNPDQIQPGELFWASATNAQKVQFRKDFGLEVSERDGKVFVADVRRDGLFYTRGIPIQPGDELRKLNHRPVQELTVQQIEHMFNTERKIEIEACRTLFGQYNDSSSSTFSSSSCTSHSTED